MLVIGVHGCTGGGGRGRSIQLARKQLVFIGKLPLGMALPLGMPLHKFDRVRFWSPPWFAQFGRQFHFRPGPGCPDCGCLWIDVGPRYIVLPQRVVHVVVVVLSMRVQDVLLIYCQLCTTLPPQFIFTLGICRGPYSSITSCPIACTSPFPTLSNKWSSAAEGSRAAGKMCSFLETFRHLPSEFILLTIRITNHWSCASVSMFSVRDKVDHIDKFRIIPGTCTWIVGKFTSPMPKAYDPVR